MERLATCKCRCRYRGPRRPDQHQLDKLADSTVQRYRKAVLPFAIYLDKYFPDVEGGSDIDDAMLEFKAGERPSKAQFEALVAGIEVTLPRLKGRIPWARAALSGWQVTHTPRHTVPMTRTVGQWFAVHFVGLGHARIAVGIMVQRAVALRPSELLGIRKEDISLPEHRSDKLGEVAFIALGVRHGTKAKRPQSVVLRDETLVGLLRYLLSKTVAGDRVFPISKKGRL